MWGPRRNLFTCCLVFLAYQTQVTHAWIWQCVSGRCVRGRNPADDNPADSLEVCRLTCGPYGALWPQPTGYVVMSNKVVGFEPAKLGFDFSGVTDYNRLQVRQLVTAFSHVWVEKVFRLCRNQCDNVPETTVAVYVTTSSGDLTLNWLTNESYTLEVATKDNVVTAHIQAETVYGARHGLETLSQMITHIAGNNQLVIVSNAKVSDKPAYPHRGLLVDTARHFLPVSTLKRQIDAMSACKMNVLHWHATDSQSFPLLLPSVPQLARFGAYSAEQIYNASDVDMIIWYARVRGVRILLELDMPAHAGNGWQWGNASGQGSLAVCVNQQPWNQYCLQPPCGQLNPANPNLFLVLREVFKDILERLPTGEAFHMGGDEVDFRCWNKTKGITDWMTSQGMGLTDSDFLNVWGDFQKKVLSIWDEEAGNSKTPILLWTSHLTQENVITEYLDKERFVIMAWTDDKSPLPTHLLNLGYRLIMVARDAWYLDHGFWGDTKVYNWRKVYDNHLPQGRGVLGGQVAMWGELVDSKNIDSRVWPRAAAAAERMWTDPQTKSAKAEYRLIGLRDRLVQYGLQPEAITPEWCAQNDGLCQMSANTS